MGSDRAGTTQRLTGTAILAALTVVFDYALKYSGIRFPFPFMPTLKFDFTGIPILLSLFMYGPEAGFTTSIVAFAAIVARSGDVLGASMKFLAEFATVLGVTGGLLIGKNMNLSGGLARTTGWATGILLRVIVMGAANLYMMPNFYGLTMESTLAATPMIAIFNLLQGSLSILMGLTLYEAIGKRLAPPKRA